MLVVALGFVCCVVVGCFICVSAVFKLMFCDFPRVAVIFWKSVGVGGQVVCLWLLWLLGVFKMIFVKFLQLGVETV